MTNTEIGKECKSYNSTEALCSTADKAIDVGVETIKPFISMITDAFPQLGSYLSEALIGASSETIKQIGHSAFATFQTAKRRKLLDKISSYNGILSNEDIESIDSVKFIIEFGKTIEVIDRVANDKKVNYIANLFGKSFIEQKDTNEDQFEEFLNHLATLSTREIDILVEMYKIEGKVKTQGQDETQKQNETINLNRKICTDKLINTAKTKWKIDEDELLGMLTSLCRTGFLREVTGAICGYQGGEFYTTAYFERFLKSILDIDDLGDIDNNCNDKNNE